MPTPKTQTTDEWYKNYTEREARYRRGEYLDVNEAWSQYEWMRSCFAEEAAIGQGFSSKDVIKFRDCCDYLKAHGEKGVNESLHF